MTALITTEALAGQLGNPHLCILDASWYMPSEKRSALAEYTEAHIPGTIFFDIDAVSDNTSPYPHMLPSAQAFAEAVGALGIGNGSEVVVYDGNGLFSAPRVWWMLRVFGHDNVKVLDGGLPKWRSESRKMEAGATAPETAIFQSGFRPELLRVKSQIDENTRTQQEQLIDARSPGRFQGSEPEPRPGLKSGHIPGSVNICFKDCVMPPYNRLRPLSELSALFKNKITIEKPTIASCGSGVTACILALSLYELGNKDVAIYDGAWAEWGSN